LEAVGVGEGVFVGFASVWEGAEGLLGHGGVLAVYLFGAF
jgi:hypothetical protein